MTRSDFHIPRQRCKDNNTILLSLYGNVAVLILDTDIIHIFAASNYKLKAKIMETIYNEILEGVGKKIRNGYFAKNITANKVMECYQKNLKEANAFSCFGWTLSEMIRFEKETHNPIIKNRLKQAIGVHDERKDKSVSQDKLNLEKLEKLKTDALGIGLRKVLSQMRKLVRHSTDVNAQIVLLLLETEFANLSAKKRVCLKKMIYESN
jgi:hypothetical protein